MSAPKDSMSRVRQAAEAAGLDLEILVMPETARTAEEAARACDCHVSQIIKSLVFQGRETERLVLLLVSGAHQADMALAAAAAGEPLVRADPRRVRDETGFAIGGVAPLGHLAPLPTYVDHSLMDFAHVWAAAGAPNAVFKVAPRDLVRAIGAIAVPLAAQHTQRQ